MKKQQSIHHHESTTLTEDTKLAHRSSPLRAVWLQLALSFGLMVYAAICPILFAFFMPGKNYEQKIIVSMNYAWTTLWTIALLGLFIVVGVYLFIDAVRVLLKYFIRAREKRDDVAGHVRPQPETNSAVPLMIMRASLENCTQEQALEALTFYLEQIGFADVEKPRLEPNYGVHLIANSNEGRFAFMIGGLTQTLTMTEVETFATGRAYFECRDALCIATSNATKDTKRRASELFIPYVDAAHYSDELTNYFTSIRSKKALV